MEDIIRLLPDSVSSRIAAGEVIQRPSSVVKEMMENAVDAGAGSVKIILTDAGRTSIQIIDDGCGMSRTDAVTSFLRHATSKISVPEDLFGLSTFGFRGEALASIAAVAEVELKTRRIEDEVGTRIVVCDEKVVSQEAVSCPVGSNFTVRNLFYNLPARRKFLKSNQTELSNIIHEVERVALSHPELAVCVYHQDSEIISLAASNLKQRIIGLFGKNMNKSLLPISTDTPAVTVSGFVGTLDSVHKRGAEQFLFVNGRYMRHSYFHKAVMEPYENLIPQGEQPPYFIFLEVPADSIDVNIHPTKTEIKFSEEQLVWKILNAAVREALGRYEGTTSIDFDTEGMPDIPIAVDDVTHVQQPKVSYNPSFNPFSNVSGRPSSERGAGWTKLFDNIASEKISEASEEYGAKPSALFDTVSSDDTCLYHCISHAGGFIVFSNGDELVMISQHRAHIAILYREYIRQINDAKVPSQGLLFPEMIQLSPSDAALLPEYEEDLNALGFEISDMGHGAVAIHGAPTGLEGVDYGQLLMEMLHTTAEGAGQQSMKRIERMALSLARHSAVSDSKVMSEKEMQELVTRLDECGMPRRTPDGKIVYSVIDSKELQSRF